MFENGFCARLSAERWLRRQAFRTAVLAATLLSSAASVRAQVKPQAYTDQAAYNIGSTVRLNIKFPPSATSVPSSLDLNATLRYVNHIGPILDHYSLAKGLSLSEGERSTGYLVLWKIPVDAPSGQYAVDLVGVDAHSHQIFMLQPSAAWFFVYRKLVKIEHLELNKTFYTSGDPVACQLSLKNLGDAPLRGLRVEFSDRYWPWIGNPDPATVHAAPLAESLSLGARATEALHSAKAATAPEVKSTAYHQYAVVVWDHDRKNIYDIAFSDLVFIRPPGGSAEEPYPLQYIYPNLAGAKVTGYRQFYPARLDSAAIQFDHRHTMYPTGAEATVKFSLSNSTDAPWRGVSVLARLLGPDGTEVARNVIEPKTDLIPGAQALSKATAFILPPGINGLFRVRVQVTNEVGQVLATNDLELATNPLPRSVLIFCAHEDDEGGWSGLARAAIENNIPIHYVYFTSGDAGSCDRYYQHSCSPAEALHFGELRMNETRASLGHLGVPRENLFFLGLPDGGSGQIWYDHLDSLHPYLSVLLSTAHAPYPDAAWPNLPYARQSVLEMVEYYIQQFEPQAVVTAHPPNQRHIDHIVNNYFVVKALQDLLKANNLSSDTQVLVDRIYDPKDVPETPYHYEERTFYVTGDVMTLAQEAWWFYQSQGGNRAEGNIRDFEKLPRTQPYRVMLDWKEHEGWNDQRPSAGSSGP
jgi:LmbE family N-acetylglucosaminyl deacetylase